MYRSQFLPLDDVSWRIGPSLKPLGKIRELHLMLNPDICNGNFDDARLEASNPIAAP